MGRRQLLGVLNRTTQIELAELLKETARRNRIGGGERLSDAAVGNWARGDRVPEYPFRRAMQVALAIDLDAWDREPDDPTITQELPVIPREVARSAVAA